MMKRKKNEIVIFFFISTKEKEGSVPPLMMIGGHRCPLIEKEKHTKYRYAAAAAKNDHNDSEKILPKVANL